MAEEAAAKKRAEQEKKRAAEAMRVAEAKAKAEEEERENARKAKRAEQEAAAKKREEEETARKMVEDLVVEGKAFLERARVLLEAGSFKEARKARSAAAKAFDASGQGKAHSGEVKAVGLAITDAEEAHDQAEAREQRRAQWQMIQDWPCEGFEGSECLSNFPDAVDACQERAVACGGEVGALGGGKPDQIEL